jgi:hypothetical protein
VELSQKSLLAQISSSLFQWDLAAFQSDLELWATHIKEEVNLLTSVTVHDEAEANSKSREILGMFSSSSELKLRLLDSCSTFDYDTP